MLVVFSVPHLGPPHVACVHVTPSSHIFSLLLLHLCVSFAYAHCMHIMWLPVYTIVCTKGTHTIPGGLQATCNSSTTSLGCPSTSKASATEPMALFLIVAPIQSMALECLPPAVLSAQHGFIIPATPASSAAGETCRTPPLPNVPAG